MEPLYFKVPRLKEETVRIEMWDLPHFYDPLHFHEDSQITFIIKGEGTIIVNSSIDTFSKGDIFVFGKNVPHVLRNDERYYKKNSTLKAKAISIFFHEESFLKIFETIPEWAGLKTLLDAMSAGLKISNENTEKISTIIEQLGNVSGIKRILQFIKLLHHISDCQTVLPLSESMLKMGNPDSNIKLNMVYEYLLENYSEQIKLDDVASLTNMTSNAFCRFFKNRTNKTFSGLLIEIRIKKACKLLAEGNCNVTEAYLSCGYNNSSNFHRHFRTVTGMTPVEYKATIQPKN